MERDTTYQQTFQGLWLPRPSLELGCIACRRHNQPKAGPIKEACRRHNTLNLGPPATAHKLRRIPPGRASGGYQPKAVAGGLGESTPNIQRKKPRRGTGLISSKSSDFQDALAPRCRLNETKICRTPGGPHATCGAGFDITWV